MRRRWRGASPSPLVALLLAAGAALAPAATRRHAARGRPPGSRATRAPLLLAPHRAARPAGRPRRSCRLEAPHRVRLAPRPRRRRPRAALARRSSPPSCPTAARLDSRPAASLQFARRLAPRRLARAAARSSCAAAGGWCAASPSPSAAPATPTPPGPLRHHRQAALHDPAPPTATARSRSPPTSRRSPRAGAAATGSRSTARRPRLGRPGRQPRLPARRRAPTCAGSCTRCRSGRRCSCG